MAAVGADVHFARRESHGNASAHPCGSGTAKEHLRIKSWPVQGDPLGQANPAWRSRGEAPDNPIRDVAKSKHHPTCTAKMGQDDLSVVDAQLGVYGVKKSTASPTARSCRPSPQLPMRFAKRSMSTCCCGSRGSTSADDHRGGPHPRPRQPLLCRRSANFLAGMQTSRDVVTAARYGTVSASFAVEAHGLAGLVGSSRKVAVDRLASITR
jgi:hypothetical protein